jgi:hypothetical protein
VRNFSNGSSSLAEVARWRAVKSTTAKSLREVSKMTVWVLVTPDGYICVFDTEDKAYNYGNRHFAGQAWDIYEREVM